MAWSANHLEVPPPRNLIVAAAVDDTAQGRHAATFSRPEFFSKISRRTDSVWILWTIPLRPSRCFFPVCSQPYRYFQYLVACNNYRIKVLSRIAICLIIICKIWRFKSGYPLWASKIPASVPPAPAAGVPPAPAVASITRIHHHLPQDDHHTRSTVKYGNILIW